MSAISALDYRWNEIVTPETDGPLELQEDLCRCEHRRLLPSDEREDFRPQPPSDTVQWVLEGMPLKRDEIGRPRPAACVRDVHERYYRSVTDQDVAGVEVGMDHVRCRSGGETSAHISRTRSTRADTPEECLESPATLDS